jgi:hypothetical protein
MKRSSFARKPYEPAPAAPLQPLRIRPNYASTSVPVPTPKDTMHRSEKYRRYVADQECFGCKLVGFSQAAHENLDKGLALKVCDSRLFPLCTVHFGALGCHEEYDMGLDGLGREGRRAWAAAMVEKMRIRARADGWRFEEAGILAPAKR